MLKFHPVHPLFIAVIQSFILAISNNYFDFLFCSAIACTSIYIVCERVKTDFIFRFCLFMLPTIVGIFITNYLFAKCEVDKLQNSATLSLKIFCISIVSVLCFRNLAFEALIIDLMKRRILSVYFGYALLSTERSFTIIKSRFKKIMYVARAREINFFSITIPLLVSVIKQSQNQAIALYGRGLSEEKKFHQELAPFKAQDFFIASVQIICFFSCIFLLIT